MAAISLQITQQRAIRSAALEGTLGVKESTKDSPMLCGLYCTHAAVFKYHVLYRSLVAQLVKKPPTIKETRVRFLGQEDPLEKG